MFLSSWISRRNGEKVQINYLNVKILQEVSMLTEHLCLTKRTENVFFLFKEGHMYLLLVFVFVS